MAYSGQSPGLLLIKAWSGPQSAWCKAEKSVLAGEQGEENLGRRDGGRQKRKDTGGSRDTPETDMCVGGDGARGTLGERTYSPARKCTFLHVGYVCDKRELLS